MCVLTTVESRASHVLANFKPTLAVPVIHYVVAAISLYGSSMFSLGFVICECAYVYFSSFCILSR